MLQNFTAKKVALVAVGLALAVGSFLGVFLGLAVGGRDTGRPPQPVGRLSLSATMSALEAAGAGHVARF